MKASHKLLAALVVLAAASGLAATALLLAAPAASAATGAAGGAIATEAWSMGLLGAALATGLSSLGAGFAVAKVGAAVGALAEKPELFGRLLIRRPRRGSPSTAHRVDPDPEQADLMTVSIYLGDEVSAAGYALAGMRTRAGRRRQAARPRWRALKRRWCRVRGHCQPDPGAELRAARLALTPLVDRADLAATVPLPDVAARLRRELDWRRPRERRKKTQDLLALVDADRAECDAILGDAGEGPRRCCTMRNAARSQCGRRLWRSASGWPRASRPRRRTSRRGGGSPCSSTRRRCSPRVGRSCRGAAARWNDGEGPRMGGLCR
jgi:V/A-type H+-transporting ATPase subunit K